jgi:hypothetical protein
MGVYHYTAKNAYDSIRATVDWCFHAKRPVPRHHPVGAYFTTLPPQTNNLAQRIRVPNEKLTHMFCFVDAGDLLPLAGGRGAYIFYSAQDYVVVRKRQIFAGERGMAP